MTIDRVPVRRGPRGPSAKHADATSILDSALEMTAAELVEYNGSIPGVVELFCALSAEATSPSHSAHEYFVDHYERRRP